MTVFYFHSIEGQKVLGYFDDRDAMRRAVLALSKDSQVKRIWTA